MFSPKGAVRRLTLALPATLPAALIALLLLSPSAHATLIADVELTELAWTQPTAIPVFNSGLFRVTNELQIGAVTEPEILGLKVRMQFMSSGVMIEETLPLFFISPDAAGYNLFAIATPVTLTAFDISDLLGPVKATVLNFICEDANGEPLACEFASQIPVTTTYEAVADIPEPSAFLLFLAGLGLLTAFCVRSGSGLAGSRPGAATD